MKTFNAQYAGSCAECGGYFPAGTPVAYVEGELVADHNHGGGFDPETVHERPRDMDLRPPGRNETFCPRCTLTHAGECP